MSATGPAIACIGGIVLDRKARVIEKLHRGSSNPVTVTTSPGGVVSNVARSLARLGCRVSLFSIVGDDPIGVSLLRELESAGIDVSNVCRSTKSPTANYTAVLEPNGELFIGLADMAVFEELDPHWADSIAPLLAQGQVWILDTNLPAPTLERLLKAHKGGATVLADPVSVAKSARLRGALDALDVLFPDRKEAAELSGHPIETRGDVGKAASEIRRLGVGTVVVTLGADGLYIDDGKSGRFLPAMSTRKVCDVTGAGDALVAGFAYGLLSGGNFEPVLYGLAAASLTIESDNSIAEALNPERLRERIESSLHATRAHESIS
jgi:sugar/nucleoside kinase (ribokinase family)